MARDATPAPQAHDDDVVDDLSENRHEPGLSAGAPFGREDFLGTGFILVLTLCYFLPALSWLDSRVLSSKGTDTWNQYFYWREFGFHAAARGELPYWNPYVFGGTPFIAGMQSAIFYPFNAIFLFLDTPAAINLSITLHFFLAACFTYAFCRYRRLSVAGSCAAAVTFTYGAPFFLHLYPGHLSNLATVPWFPLMLLGMEAFVRNKRVLYAALSGVPLALQVLAGHPQYLFYSVIGTGILFFVEVMGRTKPRELPYFVGGFCLFVFTGAALSAVQLLPTLELAQLSVRHGLTYEWVSSFSFPPENFLTILFPRLFGDYGKAPYWGRNYFWEASLYVGVIPLCFALVATFLNRSTPVKTFAGLALVSLIVALGRHTPLLRVLYLWVPGFDLFRGISKFVFLYSFAAAVLAGYGIDWLAERLYRDKKQFRGLALALIAAALIFAALGTVIYLADETWRSQIRAYIETTERDSPLPALNEPLIDSARLGAAASVWESSALLALLAVTLFVFAHATNRLLPGAFTWSIVMLTALDLWMFGQRYVVSFNPAELRMDPALKSFLQRDPNPARWTIPRLPDVNMGMIEGLENAGGYEAIVLKNYSELVNSALGWPLDHPTMVMGISAVSPIFDMMNVRYYVVGAGNRLTDPRLVLKFDDGSYKTYVNANALPRSFIVHQVKVAARREKALALLGSADFDARKTAVVSEPIDGMSDDSRLVSPPPTIVGHSLNQVSISADASAPGLLVLTDVFYPGWTAWIDGRESRIYRVNHAVRGVFVPQGHHEILFRYDPVLVKAGAVTSVFMVIVLGVWWSRWRFKSSKLESFNSTVVTS